MKEADVPFGLSPVHLIAALVIALVVIGPRKLPGLGSSAGRWIRDLRQGVVDTKDSFVAEVSAPASPAAQDQTPAVSARERSE